MNKCKVCDREKLPNSTICRYHFDNGIKIFLKVKCLDILGWKCVCCGEDNFYPLQVDHIISCIGRRESNTIGIYRKIVKNPNESLLKYQILCNVCNSSKQARKTCTVDHTLKKREDFVRYLKYIDKPV